MKLWQLALALVVLITAVIWGIVKLPELLTPSALATKCSDASSEDALAQAICDEMRQGR